MKRDINIRDSGKIPPTRCERCDFCTMINEEEGIVVCNVMGFDWRKNWSPSEVSRCSEYQNLKEQWGI